MENFYYEGMYAILQDTHQYEATSTAPRQLKDKIVRLHSTGLRRVVLDNGEHERLAGEKPTLYNLIKMRRRQESRMIREVQDINGNIHTITKDILRTFATFMRSKHGIITVDEKNVKYLPEAGKKTVPTDPKEGIDLPITTYELRLAVGKGGGHKVPGSDGICQ
jgi:hypothetical protein